MGNGHWERPVYRGPSKGAARHTPFLHLRTRGARAEKDLRNQPGIGKERRKYISQGHRVCPGGINQTLSAPYLGPRDGSPSSWEKVGAP